MFRRLLIVLLIPCFINGNPAVPDSSQYQIRDGCDDSWLGNDKIMHFSGSFFATLSAGAWARHRLDYSNQASLTASGCTCLMIGLSKELQDMKKPDNHFCLKDLAMDVLGVALGLLIMEAI